MIHDIVDIGEIGNYYGGLKIGRSDTGGFYWSITDYNGDDWEEIPSYLYDALIRFKQETE